MNLIINISQIISAIIVIIGAITCAIGFCTKKGQAWIKSNIFDPIQIPLNEKIDKVDSRIDTLEVSQCRNYLVDFMSDMEKGIAKDADQIEHAHYLYDHYTKDLNQNSYIHRKWEKLEERGLI